MIFLQRSYCELAKYTYLPNEYIFNIGGDENLMKYGLIVDHLNKVIEAEIDSPSDLSDIVEAVQSIASDIGSSDTLKQLSEEKRGLSPLVLSSSYIQSKLNQYVLLFQAKSDTMITKKNALAKDLVDYIAKIEEVLSSPHSKLFIDTFMGQLQQHFETAEAILDGRFEFTKSGENYTVDSAYELISLSPVFSGLLTQLAQNESSTFNEHQFDIIKLRAKYAIQTFYLKNVEEDAEYIAVTYLYDNQELFEKLVSDESPDSPAAQYKSDLAHTVSTIIVSTLLIPHI